MEEKKYYWIKLKTDFFNLNEIDFLLSQENGCKYIVLYQMLCLMTANNKGELSNKIGEMLIPYNPEKIARDTKYFDLDTVIVALELFKKLGLIYEQDNKILKISNFNEMIGSETKWAKYKREQRLENVQSMSNKSIEYRDKSIDIDKEKEINKEKEKYFENEELNNKYLEYLKMRKEKKCKATDTTIKNQVAKLSKKPIEEALSILQYSINNGYQGLFEQKQNRQATKEANIPKWFGKEIEQEKLGEEEEEELKKILEEFE